MSSAAAIFFDLDDTLIDDSASTRIAVEQTCHEFRQCVAGFDPSLLARTYEEVGQAYWMGDASRNVEDYSGRLPEIRAANWTAALAACGIHAPGLAQQMATFYAPLRASTVIPFDDAADILAALCPRFRMGVITNGAGAIQRAKLAAAGLDRYFDAVIASTDAGAAKPDVAIFARAFASLDADPSASWHIGDNLDADVAGAIGSGLRAAWLNRHGRTAAPQAPRPHAELGSLRDLLPLLGLKHE